MKRFIRISLHIIAILFVVAIAWGLRARAVSMLPIDYDEDDYLRAGQQFAHLIRTSDWRGFLETNYRPEHPPLAKIVFGLSILSAPEEPLTPDASTSAGPNNYLPRDLVQPARTINAIFGTLTVLALSLVNPLAGFFLAVHTFTIKYTSEIMLEALPALLILLSVLCYVQAKKNGVLKNKNFFNGWIIASAILLGLTAASKYLYCVAGIAILVDWFIEAKQNNQLNQFYKQAALWGILSLIIFFAADPYLWPNPLTRLKDSVFYFSGYAATAPEVQQANYPFWQPINWLFFSPTVWHPKVFVFSMDIFITALSAAGIKRLWQKERVYILWLGIAIFFLLIWPTKWPQYIIILTAPLSLSAAEGFQVLVVEPLQKRWAARRSRKRSVKPNRREIKRALPWLIPGLIFFIVLTVAPLVFQFAISMTDFNSISIRDGFNGGIWRAIFGGLTGQIPISTFDLQTRSNQVNFTGLNLYPPVFTYISGDPSGRSILFYNIMWTVLSVLFQSGLGLGVALLLWQRGVRLGKFWQALFILPWAIPEYIGALMWLNVFAPESGWLALAVKKFGEGFPFAFLSNPSGPNVILLVLLICAIWYGFPFMMLATSVSLKMIPQEVLDAAAIDGANSWQTFRFVTWPLLLPLIIPALIVRSIFAFNQFYLFQAFHAGDATLSTLSYYVFNPVGGFGSRNAGQFAVSAAINIIAVIILAIFVVLFNRWSKASEGVTYA